MGKIDESVALMLCSTERGTVMQTVHEIDVPDHLAKRNTNERWVLFFSSDNPKYPGELAAKWDWLYDSQRRFISSKNADMKHVIKCIPINSNDERVQRMIGQLWIMPMEEMPQIAFVEQEIRGDRKRLGDYYPLPTTASKRGREFNRLPLCCENETIEESNGFYKEKLQLSAIVKLDISPEMHADVIQLDSQSIENGEEDHTDKKEEPKRICKCPIRTIIMKVVRWILKPRNNSGL